MRKLCLPGFAFGLCACGGGNATPPPATTPPLATVATAEAPPAAGATAGATPALAPSLSDKIQASLAAMTDGWNSHDAKKIASCFADGAFFREVGGPDVTGRDAIIGAVQGNFDEFPDLRFAMSRLLIKNDVAIVEWTWTGTDTGPGPAGGKPTGNHTGAHGASVLWYTPDGLVKEEHDYSDTPTMLAQLGLSKAKGRPVATLPTGAPEMHIAKASVDEDKNVALAEAVQKMFEAHDAKGFADVIADGITWDDLTAPAPTNGKEAVLSNFKMVTKAFPDMKMKCTTWGIEDYLIEECAMIATNKGPTVVSGVNVPATNKSVNRHSLDIVQIKDGQAVNAKTYGDGMEMMRQLGLIKPEKPTKADAKTAAKPTAK